MSDGSTDFNGTPIVILRWPKGAPRTEYCQKFLQGMLNRVAQAFFKYGAMADAYPQKVNAIESLEKRLAKYKTDHNTEWLMDVGNFAMIEFKHPAHADASFRATTSKESPGRKWHGEVDANARGNKES